jgi:cytochrome c
VPRRIAIVLLALCACDSPPPPRHMVAMGDPERGRAAIERHQCVACHTIPGIDGPDGVVGPPLTDFGLRTHIAGFVPNAPGNLIAWLRDPPAVSPRTGMPDLGIGEAEARDIAAYLYTLGDPRALDAPIPRRASVPREERLAAERAAAALLEGGGAGLPIERAMEIVAGRTGPSAHP